MGRQRQSPGSPGRYPRMEALLAEVNPTAGLPPGFTEEEILWPRMGWWERLTLALGYGDRELGRAYREAVWIVRCIKESCRACRIHSPGDKQLPAMRVFVPALPTADPATSVLLTMPPGVRVGRVGDNFVQDLRSRLGGFDVELTINAAGVWVRVPRDRTPPKPPQCTLPDLGDPPQRYRLPLPLGRAQHGPYWADLADAPHALFAGATGSGKSTLIHTCLHFILERAEVWGIDLKLVELSRYKGRMARLATDPEEVEPLLAALFQETRRRLTAMRERGANAWTGQRLVLVVDELAEVTLASKGDTQMLLRLAQLGRAAGVHLLLATQRPSVQIIPGDLKANVPLRVALALPTGVDSRVVLDREGAETLTPPGDAYVLQGHKITRISTPDFKAPAPDAGAVADPRLIGLTADERAALQAIQAAGCKATVRGLKAHFHWGTPRATRAFQGLQHLGWLDADPAPDSSTEQDVLASTPVDESVLDVLDVLPRREKYDFSIVLGTPGTPGTLAPPCPQGYPTES
ncbi:MAG TPA: FtsK/SpoIIIE domain-containing protein [Anaerolineae bacterium]|nr:FtsK/SpoIIIE domain-containing protein [Anaerolineae bacterium]HQI83152.1 FtsK/SpoIIIE domain-containing protein [Anaerolineae bacterium]